MLSVLCVTRAEPYTRPFLADMARLALVCGGEFVVAVDGPDAAYRLEAMEALDLPARVVSVRSKGYIESVLDDAVLACAGTYVLRLDDDEACSAPMVQWLAAGCHREADHWKFPRYHLWYSRESYIANAPLWPDHQTRLSVRAKAGKRRTIHAGSPFGGGRLAPVAIEHHKFLVKSAAERRAIAERYDAVTPGFGTGGFLPFNLPEEVYRTDTLEIHPVGWAHVSAQRDAEEAA